MVALKIKDLSVIFFKKMHVIGIPVLSLPTISTSNIFTEI